MILFAVLAKLSVGGTRPSVVWGPAPHVQPRDPLTLNTEMTTFK